MVRKRRLQHPARHAQRLGVVAHVVAGQPVIAPQLHRGDAVEHAARAQEQHVKVLLFFKKRAVLALGIVAAHAPVKQRQAADQRRQPDRGHRNFFLHLQHPFWGCRPKPRLRDIVPQTPNFASRRLTADCASDPLSHARPRAAHQIRFAAPDRRLRVIFVSRRLTVSLRAHQNWK